MLTWSTKHPKTSKMRIMNTSRLRTAVTLVPDVQDRLKSIIHASAHNVGSEANRFRNARHDVKRLTTPQIDVKIFNLERPIPRDTGFQTAANSPARTKITA